MAGSGVFLLLVQPFVYLRYCYCENFIKCNIRMLHIENYMKSYRVKSKFWHASFKD